MKVVNGLVMTPSVKLDKNGKFYVKRGVKAKDALSEFCNTDTNGLYKVVFTSPNFSIISNDECREVTIFHK